MPPSRLGSSNYEQYLERLRSRQWKIEDIPFYDSGRATDFAAYEEVDYLDVYHQIWGRRCGDNGLGRLKEVALAKLDPDQDSSSAELVEEQATYAALLEEHGVRVRWIDASGIADASIVAAATAPSQLWIIRGGSIVPKPADPINIRRSAMLARWAQHTLGIPVLYSVVGTGVHEPATTLWFGDDTWVTGLSPAYNAEGNRQLLSVISRSARMDEVIVHTVHLAVDSWSGLDGRLSSVLCPLDRDKALVYSGGVDAGTHRWLRRRGYAMAEIARDEQLRYRPSSAVMLEAGVVFMGKEAERAIAAVRDVGVEVIEVPSVAFSGIGVPLRSRTLHILRDNAPG